MVQALHHLDVVPEVELDAKQEDLTGNLAEALLVLLPWTKSKTIELVDF